VGLKLWVSGWKKGKVRRAIEERVLSEFQMVKLKPRGNEYGLTFAFEEEDEISQIVAQIRWDMELLADLEDCSIEVEWLGVAISGETVVEEPNDYPHISMVETSLNAVDVIRVYQLKIMLLGVRPQVWRRIQVPETTTLARLHTVLQAVMGWEGYHLHEFSLSEDESIPLANLLGDKLFTFTYLYDFGDMWEHEIEVEKRLASESGKDYPVCLAGKRACPPEDCGGDWGYAYLLKVLKNRRHPEYRERKEWVGRGFDPAAFDLEEVNQALRELEVEAAGYGD
jgi:hypothetical protein